jgi:membrane-associated phospholipid phosphatase
MTPIQNWLRAHKSLVAHVSTNLLVGILISIVCLWAFLRLVGEVFGEQDTQLDLAIANGLHAAATPAATTVFLDISLLGFQVLFVVAVLVGLFFIWKRQWLRLGVWIAALAGGELLDLLLKTWFARPRPVFANPITVALYYSFPSGHATMSVITYGLLAYFLYAVLRRAWMRVISAAALILLILAIGVSRIYLGVHYFTDVLAGFAIGGLWLAFCITTMDFIIARRGRNAPD